MTILADYNQFDGIHWETGTVRNYYDYRGVTAPHSGEPYSEALLLGISGGIVMGYFSFAYEGYDPQARILTRNTFDPLDTLLQRLGVAQNLVHTASPERAVRNVVQALEEGTPAIVWADASSLPYDGRPYDEEMWHIFPILVYGYDEAADTVWIADRARVPLTATTAELAAARGRIKKYKHRLLTLEAPDPDKLPAAVTAGINDCIQLFTEKPPRGARHNFGLAAFRHWAKLLRQPGPRMSWAKQFPPGEKMVAGLTSAFADINLFGKDGQAERDTYAEFLEEAAALLERPALHEAAAHFRESALAWDALSQALLPDDIGPFAEMRELMLRRHQLFLHEGVAAVPAMQEVDARLAALRTTVAADFPLDQDGVEAMRANIAARVMDVHDIEETAVAAMAEAMKGD